MRANPLLFLFSILIPDLIEHESGQDAWSNA